MGFNSEFKGLKKS